MEITAYNVRQLFIYEATQNIFFLMFAVWGYCKSFIAKLALKNFTFNSSLIAVHISHTHMCFFFNYDARRKISFALKESFRKREIQRRIKFAMECFLRNIMSHHYQT